MIGSLKGIKMKRSSIINTLAKIATLIVVVVAFNIIPDKDTFWGVLLMITANNMDRDIKAKQEKEKDEDQ